MMRTNSFRPVWVKSKESQRIGAMFTARNTIQDQLIRIENVIRGILRCDGISLSLGRRLLESQARERAGSDAELMAIIEPMLAARAELLKQRAVFDRRIVSIARNDQVCKLLMTAPGVGAHIALAFKAGIDDPKRFTRSRTVGAHFGLSPRQYASGEIDYSGRCPPSAPLRQIG